MDTVFNCMFAIRRLVLAIAARLQWLPPTLARFTVGWIFLWSGWGKLHNLDSVIEFFGSLGIPHPELQAPFASATELVCGTLVLAGLFTRIASVPLIVTMVVAILTAQRENVAAVGDLFGLAEYLYVVLLLWLGICGGGPLSVDHLLVRWAERRAPATRTATVGSFAATTR
jgi:putative oxidoreductase